MPAKTFSPVTPLTKYWAESGFSLAKGKQVLASDPDFPRDELVQVGVNRLGITERGKAIYQRVLMERAKQPRPVSPNLANPKVAAARSVEVRRAKAARGAEPASAS